MILCLILMFTSTDELIQLYQINIILIKYGTFGTVDITQSKPLKTEKFSNQSDPT